VAEDPESEAKMTEINASEILDKIRKGEPVKYDHVIIKGELELGKLNLPKRLINRTDIEINSLGFEYEITIITSIIKITNSEIQGISNFSDAAFDQEIDFSGSRFNKEADFRGSRFNGPTDFSWSQFSEYALFGGSQFFGGAIFEGCQFNEWADFMGFRTRGGAEFHGCQFNKKADFLRSRFTGYIADFSESKFSGHTIFRYSMFADDALFGRCAFNGDTDFSGSQFKGDVLTFKHSKFSNPKSQEEACRKAKNVLEKNGNREDAGYHFYREMEGKRKQKEWYFRYPEFFFVQLIFGYGVHPFRLMFCWFLVATIFAFYYSANGGIISKLPTSTLPQPLSYFVECFYFSIVTAVTPGYGKYELASWEYQAIASIEAIFGTFMWAAFIATFARKYMR
jgi:hypothetical protein